jgi:hypothetical protein
LLDCTTNNKEKKMAVETYFLLTVNEDGTLTSYTDIPEELPEQKRVATNWDVYTTAKQIVEEFDRQLLVDRVVQGVVNVLMPPAPPTSSDKVKDALKDRGIDPESTASAE